MGATRTCRKCGSEFSGVALEGLCPSCLGRLAFVSEPEAGTGAAAASRSSYADLAEEIPTVIAPVQLTEGPGTVIDHYKLLEKIGEGGFGAVYVAEQREPLKRRVALTVLSFAGVHSTMAQGGTWTTKAPMPEPRVESAAAAVNGRLYYSAIGID